MHVEEGGPLLSALNRFKLLLPFKQVVGMRRQGRKIFKLVLLLEKQMVENMLSLVKQVVGKIFKLLVSLAMEMIVIWVPLEKQVVGKSRPKRKFFQLGIPFVI